jgi:hypothetical protein
MTDALAWSDAWPFAGTPIETRGLRCWRRHGRDGRATAVRQKVTSMDFAERSARNEEIFRGVNERIEEGAERHAVSAALPFHCECGNASCVETIEIEAAHYAAIMRERYRFVIIPGHQDPEIEQIVERRPDYLVVEKIGEARKQIDRDHPQQHHHR